MSKKRLQKLAGLLTEDMGGSIDEASKFKNSLDAAGEMRNVIKTLKYLDGWVRGEPMASPKESSLDNLRKSVDDIIEYVKSEMEKEKAYYAKQRVSK